MLINLGVYLYQHIEHLQYLNCMTKKTKLRAEHYFEWNALVNVRQ